MKSRVAVAMSGGVDSAVAAWRLLEEGYQPTGVTLELWTQSGSKQTAETVAHAARVCRILGIPHQSIDIRTEFETRIVQSFARQYLAGLTPNPCVDCNHAVKWRSILQFAKREGIPKVATGHYARLVRNRDTGRYEIRKGIDRSKDQSYVLWQLDQGQLADTILPLGDFSKNEVIDLANRNQLVESIAQESQDICFIPHNSYREFLESYLPQELAKIGTGELVDAEGNVLGCHDGFFNFTIGQRKGFRMGFGERRYVQSIDPARNLVVIGEDESLYRKAMYIGNLNWVAGEPCDSIRGEMKIRYHHSGAECQVTRLEDGRYIVRFMEAQRAITPGQAAVLYDGDRLLFGATILE